MRRLVSLALLLILCAGCTFLYIPPTRAPVEVTPRLSLRDSPGLKLERETLVLALQLQDIPGEGWLSVQWFDPANRQVSSDALWLTFADEGFTRRFALGPRLELRPGEWRAVVGFDGEVVRQFALELTGETGQADPVDSE